MSETSIKGWIRKKLVALVVVSGLSIYAVNVLASIVGSSFYIEAGLGNYTAVLSAVVVLNFFLKGRPE